LSGSLQKGILRGISRRQPLRPVEDVHPASIARREPSTVTVEWVRGVLGCLEERHAGTAGDLVLAF
jgi:hypothetical protein